jgi:ABC-2 type transport system permease protein
MRTIFLIARKELREQLRDGRARTVGVIVTLLLAASLISGWRQSREFREQQRIADVVAREQWENQGEKNPHSAAHFGTYAFKAPTLLSSLDRGVDAYLGVAVWIEAHKQNPFLFRPAEDATEVARFGELSAASILQTLVPLVLILLTFSAISGERENSTLKQLLSLGISGRTLFCGKALGIAGALALLFAPAMALGIVTLAWQNSPAVVVDGAIRLCLLTICYLLYFGIVIGVALLVSAQASSSRVALVILLACWIGNCLIVPRLAADLSERLYPTPSGEEFWDAIEREMKDGVDGHDPASARTEELKQQVLKQYGVMKVEDLPVNFTGLALQAGEEFGNRVFNRRYGELWTLYDRQNRVHRSLTLFAPLNALRPLSAGLAGTDFASHRQFAVAAETYRRMLNKRMNETLAYNSRGNSFGYEAGSDLWKATPKFEYAAPGFGTVFRQQAWNLALLSAWFVLVWLVLLRVAGRLKS